MDNISPPRSFLARRLARGEYLGLHFTVGLSLFVATLALFSVLAALAPNGDGSLVQFDHRLANDLHEHALANASGERVFQVITDLGNKYSLIALALLVTGLLFWRRLYLLALAFPAAIAGSAALNTGIKYLFLRQRPSFEHALVHETSTSFPSGHAMNAMAAYGMLAYLVVLLVPNRLACVASVVGLTIVVLLVGFSRMYLGAHYFSDVVAGFTVGACWLAVLITALEVLRRRPREASRGDGIRAD